MRGVVIVAAAVACACNLGSTVSLEADADVDGPLVEGGSDAPAADVLGDGEGSWDSGLPDGAGLGGSLTQILSGIDVLDERLERCIDGDATVISGRDCWQDEGMADAISMTLRLGVEGARFAGRLDDWDYSLGATCPEGPPVPSLWDAR